MASAFSSVTMSNRKGRGEAMAERRSSLEVRGRACLVHVLLVLTVISVDIGPLILPHFLASFCQNSQGSISF
jgi:hypothetical protein